MALTFGSSLFQVRKTSSLPLGAVYHLEMQYKSFALLLVTLLLPVSSLGVELRELSIQYKRYNEGTRYPYMMTKPNDGLNLKMDIDVIGGLYFDNRIVSNTDDGQYRFVGWNFQVGLRLFPALRIQYEHFSQHLMEQVNPATRFPVEDSIGFVWTIHQAPPSVPRNLFDSVKSLF
jgi:hypothetical protein